MLKRISILLFIGFIIVTPLFSETKERLKPLPPSDLEQLMAPGPELAGAPGLPIENEVWVLLMVGVLMSFVVVFKPSVSLVFSSPKK